MARCGEKENVMNESLRTPSTALRETRWQPARSGLINFYRYDDQEFHFHQGRMLLRGNNGTGKSRVLALQLPFLLDGETSPERVEPDGDRAKRFEWNLLMGKHDDRLGYTWLEFRRHDGEGMPHYFTIGCGARAVAGRGIVAKWFFTTRKRVGHDLHLCSAQKTPLSREALGEALAGEGQLFTTASAYRDDVNRELFGLSRERYEALVKLLIGLRQPKLSRHLDEKSLSLAMGESLPPMSSHMVQQVSDAMKEMEEDRRALAALQSAQESTAAFLSEYRRYAQMIACRRSEDVRKLHNEYENGHRKLRAAQADLATALAGAEKLRARESQLSLDMAAAQARKATLEGSPQMKSARDLEAARTLSDERRKEADTAQAEHASSLTMLERAAAELTRDRENVEHLAERLRNRTDKCDLDADACDVAKQHHSAIARAGLPQQTDLGAIDAAEKATEKLCDQRKDDSRLLRSADEEVAAAQQLWTQALERRDSHAATAAEETVALQAREAALAEARKKLVTGYREWAASLKLLKIPEDAELAAHIAEWCDENARNAGPVRIAVDAAIRHFHQLLAIERATIATELRTEEQSLMQLMRQREHLLSGEHQTPPPPHTRDPDSRLHRAGAPLWKLCEFADAVSPSDRAAIEAALESAGLLDAWVTPDGHVDTPPPLDTFLLDSDMPRPEASLLKVLRPSTHTGAAPVAPHVVTGLLARLGFGPNAGPAWVDASGRWQMGLLSGRWEKAAAQHLGHTAREAERLRRLQECDAAIHQHNESIATRKRALDEITARSRAGDDEAGRAPSEEEIRSALAERNAGRLQLEQARLRLLDMEAALARAKESLHHKSTQRDNIATDLGLSRWINRSTAYDEAINAYRQGASALWTAAREHLRAAGALEASQHRHDHENDRCARLYAASRNAAEKAAAAESQYQTLHEMVGGAVEEVQAQLHEIESQLKSLADAVTSNARELGAATAHAPALRTSIDGLHAQIADTDLRRTAAIARLLNFTATSLIDITHDSLAGLGRGKLADTAAVDLAHRILATLAAVPFDDAAWANTQRTIHQHIQNLTNALQGHDYRPEVTTEDDTVVVTSPVNRTQRPMKEFSAWLSEEIVNRRSLLTARELELLENYLIHDLAVEMGKLIRGAEELVADMNRQLLARPNSTGMTLRFAWQPDPESPPAFADARRKLLGDDATWSPADRTALGQFLQEQIDRARQSAGTSSWHELLSIALDYRRWHQFHVERRQDGKWVRLNRKTHGTGSGGEKAVALTIPQFAAAAAYYDSAARHAPRLILLDEAFVGIDSDMRAKCMGLLHEFDLDFVMTSEREWGCYATMPGLAIYQLSARADIDAVYASHWIWNGHQRLLQPPDAPPSPDPARRDDGLFPVPTDSPA
jgi:uncharacterized protein (TIGR02680 family)